MVEMNKRNLVYFESNSMKELFNLMDEWQIEHEKRFLSISIEQDSGHYCCIGLTNPSEVVITDSYGRSHASVDSSGYLWVRTKNE